MNDLHDPIETLGFSIPTLSFLLHSNVLIRGNLLGAQLDRNKMSSDVYAELRRYFIKEWPFMHCTTCAQYSKDRKMRGQPTNLLEYLEFTGECNKQHLNDSFIKKDSNESRNTDQTE